MILWFINKYSKVTPVIIDGMLYVLIAVFGAITAGFTTDEAYKYINPSIIFWIKTLAEIGIAATSALKMFRSTSYSDHLNSVKNGTSEPPKSTAPVTTPPNSALSISTEPLPTTTAKPTTLSNI